MYILIIVSTIINIIIKIFFKLFFSSCRRVIIFTRLHMMIILKEKLLTFLENVGFTCDFNMFVLFLFVRLYVS